MSRVTYILGAGASYGQQTSEKARKTGLPIVSQFADEVHYCLEWLRTTNEYRGLYELYEQDLQWLHQVCLDYPTVDTYARLLFVTQNSEYNRLKHILSIFLIIEQLRYPHDIRYDGWLASIIDDKGNLPKKLSVLSWNYDLQLELAFHRYRSNLGFLSTMKQINSTSKTYFMHEMDGSNFALIKINGSAAFNYEKNNGVELY